MKNLEIVPYINNLLKIKSRCASCGFDKKQLSVTVQQQISLCREKRLKEVYQEIHREHKVWILLHRLFHLSLFLSMADKAQQRMDAIQLLLEVRDKLSYASKNTLKKTNNYHQACAQAFLLGNLPPCATHTHLNGEKYYDATYCHACAERQQSAVF
jgi:asparagine synthetase B (glutamine-hydrolysing)